MGEKKVGATPETRRGPRMTRRDVRVSCALAILLLLALARAAAAWGPEGHVIVTRAALAASDGLPPWFRDAGDALAELSNAPDRWREAEKDAPALAARGPDHFFDLDVWGDEPLPPERWGYVARAVRRRLSPAAVGFLPFAIGEEYGVLLTAFRDVRAGRPGGREAALAAAGVLAHLAGDAAVPLHATRHHHGWVGPNPEGFTRAGEIHHWFEGALVAGVGPAGGRAARGASRAVGGLPGAVRARLGDSPARGSRAHRVQREGPRARAARGRLRPVPARRVRSPGGVAPDPPGPAGPRAEARLRGPPAPGARRARRWARPRARRARGADDRRAARPPGGHGRARDRARDGARHALGARRGPRARRGGRAPRARGGARRGVGPGAGGARHGRGGCRAAPPARGDRGTRRLARPPARGATARDRPPAHGGGRAGNARRAARRARARGAPPRRGRAVPRRAGASPLGPGARHRAPLRLGPTGAAGGQYLSGAPRLRRRPRAGGSVVPARRARRARARGPARPSRRTAARRRRPPRAGRRARAGRRPLGDDQPAGGGSACSSASHGV